ncbi:hypothetical protein FNH22_11965 [Fulvivirga sp. M361]|uniref:hypothetical protein n=1 Tax=Fulvivirga sp. M361 TaxID=2594266 RepID=UPI0011799701|nr:hypothetical protein [Fulvivirga sp. M361]TRX59232.1 hypothetical protein FNH22_11965 [Fulvivirga sp. M361]
MSTSGKAYQFTMGAPNGYEIRAKNIIIPNRERTKTNADHSMLYYLEKDPNEFNNLTDDPVMQELSEKISAAILKKMSKYIL